MIPVQDILSRVTDLLLDDEREDDQARWTDAELLRWLNDSRMAILTRRPQVFSKLVTVELIAGTQQRIPDNGVQLLDVVRNMGTGGIVPGRSIRRTDRQEIDDNDPLWHQATAASVISNFMHDDRTPKDYFVSPPAVAGTQIQIVHAQFPEAVNTVDDEFDIDPENIEAVVNYVCYRAKSKDSEYSNSAEAAAFYAAFQDVLGVTGQAQMATSPNQVGNSV